MAWTQGLSASLMLTAAALLSGGTAVRPATAEPAITCEELAAAGELVSLTDRELAQGDGTGMCLTAYPGGDTFHVFLPNLASAGAFRAAKQRFSNLMWEANIDLCRITAWRPLNRAGDLRLPLTLSDRLDSEVPCTPRVISAGTGGKRWDEPVQRIVADVGTRAVTSLRVLPNRPLTIELHSEPSSFAVATQSILPDVDITLPLYAARDARSLTAVSPVRGVIILLNLFGNPDPDTIQQRIAHEYIHYLQSIAGGALDSFPLWFLEGQAEYHMVGLAGADWDRLDDARRREQEERAPRLLELTTAGQWSLAERRYGNGVYSRSYAAYLFIVNTWGLEAALRIMRSATAGAVAVDNALRRETGFDVAQFDNRLSSWLRDGISPMQ